MYLVTKDIYIEDYFGDIGEPLAVFSSMDSAKEYVNTLPKTRMEIDFPKTYNRDWKISTKRTWSAGDYKIIEIPYFVQTTEGLKEIIDE